MIIQSDNMQFSAKRSYRESRSGFSGSEIVNESTSQNTGFLNGLSLRLLEGNRNDDAAEETENKPASAESPDTLSDLVNHFQSTQSIRSSVLKERLRALDQIKRQTLDYLVQILFGRENRTQQLNGVYYDSGTTFSTQTVRQYSYFTYSENETTSFDGKGSVVTADGRQIDFNINLTMSRSFTETASSYIDFTQPVLCDPLVINLDSNIATVSDQKFFFDLDADGEEEEISNLNPGSGYLALDKNGDGIINDGSELFGTASGNGFADLAAYDSDGNGWIDEADDIFQKLKIWTKDENGNDKLCGLGEAGVGAIYLGSADTEFSLKGADNTTNAVIRKTGMFLYENGNTGTLQQLDLAT